MLYIGHRIPCSIIVFTCYIQVIIFVKSVQRCMALAQLLLEQNFPAIAIHRAMTQEERLSRYQQFKVITLSTSLLMRWWFSAHVNSPFVLQDFSKRILVATNLFGRGMDIERVNIVFNYDMPEDSDTYLHRVARAGRFGTKGMYMCSPYNPCLADYRPTCT